MSRHVKRLGKVWRMKYIAILWAFPRGYNRHNRLKSHIIWWMFLISAKNELNWRLLRRFALRVHVIHSILLESKPPHIACGCWILEILKCNQFLLVSEEWNIKKQKKVMRKVFTSRKTVRNSTYICVGVVNERRLRIIKYDEFTFLWFLGLEWMLECLVAKRCSLHFMSSSHMRNEASNAH